MPHTFLKNVFLFIYCIVWGFFTHSTHNRCLFKLHHENVVCMLYVFSSVLLSSAVWFYLMTVWFEKHRFKSSLNWALSGASMLKSLTCVPAPYKASFPPHSATDSWYHHFWCFKQAKKMLKFCISKATYVPSLLFMCFASCNVAPCCDGCSSRRWGEVGSWYQKASKVDDEALGSRSSSCVDIVTHVPNVHCEQNSKAGMSNISSQPTNGHK